MLLTSDYLSTLVLAQIVLTGITILGIFLFVRLLIAKPKEKTWEKTLFATIAIVLVGIIVYGGAARINNIPKRTIWVPAFKEMSEEAYTAMVKSIESGESINFYGNPSALLPDPNHPVPIVEPALQGDSVNTGDFDPDSI